MEGILRYHPAPEGGLKVVPAEGAQKIEMWVDEQGKRRKLAPIISGGTQVVGDDSQMSTLMVKKEDVPHLVSALQWRADLGADAINFTTLRSERDGEGNYVTVEQTGDIHEIFVPGRFDPQPTTADISAIIEEYQLLAKKFPRRADVFRQKIGANTLTEILILALLKSQNVKLPKWVEKVLELRKEAKGAKESAGEDEFGWEK